MSMRWIRDTYDVPAKRGGRVRFQGEEGRILSATHWLTVRLDSGRKIILHPRWELDYLDEKGVVQCST